MPVDVSIIVCCHNSAARLGETLAHLSRVEPVEGQRWEVVLVDNGSTDDTAETARRLWAAHAAAAPLNVVAEPVLGLIHARKAGLAAARHEIVSFVDDDNWVGPEWLQVIDRIFSEHPEVGALGGRGFPAFEGGAAPTWFDRVQHCYACGPQARRSGPIPPRVGSVYGAGASFRAEALAELSARGFEHFLTGRQGDTLLSGEDSELSLTLAALGWTIWYDEELTFEHFMPQGRLTKSYVDRLVRQLGVTSALLDAYYIGFSRRTRLWRALNQSYGVRLAAAASRFAVACALDAIARSPDTAFTRHFMRGRLEGVTAQRQLFEVILDRQSAFYRGLSNSPAPA